MYFIVICLNMNCVLRDKIYGIAIEPVLGIFVQACILFIYKLQFAGLVFKILEHLQWKDIIHLTF